MTVTIEAAITEAMHGNGLVTEWPFEFFVKDKASITLIVREVATGADTFISQDSFSVEGLESEDGGTVTYPLSGDPLSSAYDVFIARNEPYEQATNYNNPGGMHPSVLEPNFDAIVRQIQQNRRDIGRAAKASYGVAGPTIPVAEPNALIGWNGAGTGFENKTAAGTGEVFLTPFSSFGESVIPRSVGDRTKDYIDILEFADPAQSAVLQTSGWQTAIDLAVSLNRRIVSRRISMFTLKPSSDPFFTFLSPTFGYPKLCRALRIPPCTRLRIDMEGSGFQLADADAPIASSSSGQRFYMMASDMEEELGVPVPRGTINDIQINDCDFFHNGEILTMSNPTYSGFFAGFDEVVIDGGRVRKVAGIKNGRGFTFYNGRGRQLRNIDFEHVAQGAFMTYTDENTDRNLTFTNVSECLDYDLAHFGVDIMGVRSAGLRDEAQLIDLSSVQRATVSQIQGKGVDLGCYIYSKERAFSDDFQEGKTGWESYFEWAQAGASTEGPFDTQPIGTKEITLTNAVFEDSNDSFDIIRVELNRGTGAKWEHVPLMRDITISNIHARNTGAIKVMECDNLLMSGIRLIDTKPYVIIPEDPSQDPSYIDAAALVVRKSLSNYAASKLTGSVKGVIVENSLASGVIVGNPDDLYVDDIKIEGYNGNDITTSPIFGFAAQYLNRTAGELTVGYVNVAGASGSSGVSERDIHIEASGVSLTKVRKNGKWISHSTQNNNLEWTGRTITAAGYMDVIYVDTLGRYIAVGSGSGGAGAAAWSEDGITFTPATTVQDGSWQSVAFSSTLGSGLGRLVAVSASGTGRVMYSDDAGVTWTLATAAEANTWRSVAWSAENAIFVAVSQDGTNRVMTSADGITWAAVAAAAANNWRSVIWCPAPVSLFVAVSNTGTGNRVMTSPTGAVWTSQTSAADNNWINLAYSSDLRLIVAVGQTGTGNRVMTSPDGINWTIGVSAADNSWTKVIWSSGLGLFIAVAGSGTLRSMASSDGSTWVAYATADETLTWQALAWSEPLGLAVSLASAGSGNRLQTTTGQKLLPFKIGGGWAASNFGPEPIHRQMISADTTVATGAATVTIPCFAVPSRAQILAVKVTNLAALTLDATNFTRLSVQRIRAGVAATIGDALDIDKTGTARPAGTVTTFTINTAQAGNAARLQAGDFIRILAARQGNGSALTNLSFQIDAFEIESA